MGTLVAVLVLAAIVLRVWYVEVLDDAGKAEFRAAAAHRWRRMVKAVTGVLYGGAK